MRYKSENRRGRPNGRYRSQVDTQLLYYLAKVSMKYDIDPDNFFNSFLESYQRGKSKCGELSIECRVKKPECAVFLITKNLEVVAQFSMSEYILKEKIKPIKEFTSRLLDVRKTIREDTSNASGNYKIRDLRAGMSHLNIKAQVLEVSQPRHVATRRGFYINVANALVADETGSIKMSLWESQIDAVSVQDTVQIVNAQVVSFRNELQLRIGRNGRINVVKPAQPQKTLG